MIFRFCSGIDGLLRKNMMFIIVNVYAQKTVLEAQPAQGDQCLVPSSACLVLVAALARPECGVVLVREEFEKTWLCYVWYWLFIAWVISLQPSCHQEKETEVCGQGEISELLPGPTGVLVVHSQSRRAAFQRCHWVGPSSWDGVFRQGEQCGGLESRFMRVSAKHLTWLESAHVQKVHGAAHTSTTLSLPK